MFVLITVGPTNIIVDIIRIHKTHHIYIANQNQTFTNNNQKQLGVISGSDSWIDVFQFKNPWIAKAVWDCNPYCPTPRHNFNDRGHYKCGEEGVGRQEDIVQRVSGFCKGLGFDSI